MNYKNQTEWLIDALKNAWTKWLSRSELSDIYVNWHRIANITARIRNARSIWEVEWFYINMEEEKCIVLQWHRMRRTRYYYINL